MKKRDALKLNPGDRITYGPSMWTANFSDREVRDGEVVRVTSKGGIKVQVLTDRGEPSGDVQWVPYHHVITYWRPVRDLWDLLRAAAQMKLEM